MVRACEDSVGILLPPLRLLLRLPLWLPVSSCSSASVNGETPPGDWKSEGGRPGTGEATAGGDEARARGPGGEWAPGDRAFCGDGGISPPPIAPLAAPPPSIQARTLVAGEACKTTRDE